MGAKGTKLSKEDLRFLEENTNFQKTEIKQWFKGFMVSQCRDEVEALLVYGSEHTC